jgi:hypothetical protein
VLRLPNKYSKLSNDRSVILKIHGTIDRADFERDRYVITEEHYIDYLTHTDPTALVPASIMARLQNVNFSSWVTACLTGTCG